MRNEIEGASRTFVISENDQLIGYYALVSGSIAHAAAPGAIRRNMPDPIPVAILGRLAIAKGWQNQGLGGEMLQDAVSRVMIAADVLGIRAMLIHALSERARTFYEGYGFRRSPADEMMLMANLSVLRKAFA